MFALAPLAAGCFYNPHRALPVSRPGLTRGKLGSADGRPCVRPRMAICYGYSSWASANRATLMQPPRHSRAETSHDATKSAIRRISLGSVSNGA
jgi:hypothetical protein